MNSGNNIYSWIVIQVRPNLESRFQAEIQDLIKELNKTELVRSILAPELTASSGKNTKLLPGYIALDLMLDQEIITGIRKIPGFIRFLGGYQPKALTGDAIESLLAIDRNSCLKQNRFVVGQLVSITQGPFNSFRGYITSIDEAKGTCQIEIQILGRLTAIVSSLDQIEHYE